MSVMIVDDSLDMCRSLRFLLEAEGVRDVFTAQSASQAFELLKSRAAEVDAILMDITMPNTDGIEACGRIKAQEDIKSIPVIMVTGMKDEQHLQRAFAAGAMDYITKPVRAAELMARLRSALTLKHELDCRRQREQELQQVTRQLQEANVRLERLSNIDELTGVANRRLFNQTFAKELARAVRERSALSLLMTDIDHFKPYNDVYGHQQGDQCLRRVAMTIRSIARRPSDLVARYGGEEFAVILPATQPPGAMVLAETMRKQVEALDLPHVLSPVDKRVTLSLGVASMLPGEARTAEALIAAADQALYQAKREGRNRVRLASATKTGTASNRATETANS